MDKVLSKAQSKLQKHLSPSAPPPPVGASHHPSHGTSAFPIDRPDDPLPVVPQPGRQPPGPGRLPPRVAQRTYLDRHQFFHPSGKRHNTMRDLGFTGVLDGKIVWCWGDTLMGTEDSARICAVDSTSIGAMQAPMCSMDTALDAQDNVRSWIPTTAEEDAGGGYTCYSFGGTNIVETAPNRGVVWYLKMHRPGGVYTCHGAGVATCSMRGGSMPVATRAGEKLWNAFEPGWGDVGACLNAADGHVYVFGHGPSTDAELSSRTYLCRVPAGQATDVAAYEYWLDDERTWTKRRIANGALGTINCTKEQAIFGWHAMNQSAPFWSNYFNCWMFLHSTGWPVSPVICQTADRLEGPWTDHGEVATTLPAGHQEDGFRYAVNGHPEFDPSGKTVLATWTKNNVIWGVRIEWE